jgi:hypothetical protein
LGLLRLRGKALALLTNNVYAIYAKVNNVYVLFFGVSSMPRPEIYPVKKIIGFNTTLLDAIDKWRAKQRPIPNVSDAIRHLIEAGLKATLAKGR